MFEVLAIDTGRFNILLLVPQLNWLRKILKFENHLQTFMVRNVILVFFTGSCSHHFQVPSEYLVEVTSLSVSDCGGSKGRDELKFS